MEKNMKREPKTPEEKVTRYYWFYRLRNEGYSEEQIAKKLKQGSAAALYQKLRQDGFPVCEVCGAYSGNNGRCTEHIRRRKAQSRGEDVELLPAAESLIRLFGKDLDLLNRYSAELPFVWQHLEGERFMSMLSVRDDDPSGHYEKYLERYRKIAEEGSFSVLVVSEDEDLQRLRKMIEKRGIQAAVLSEEKDLDRLLKAAEDGSIRTIISKEEDLERLLKVAEQRGMRASRPDPEEEDSKRDEQLRKYRKWYEDLMGLHPDPTGYPPLTSSLYTHGSKPTPWEGFLYLITMHALMHDSVEPLLDALHPEPQKVDREQLYYKETVGPKGKVKKDGYIYNLKLYAERIAKTVCGAEVRTGHHPGEVSPEEMWGALNLIAPLAAEMGYSDKEIYWQLKEHLLDEEDRFLGVKYTVPEIKRLRNLFVMRG